MEVNSATKPSFVGPEYDAVAEFDGVVLGVCATTTTKTTEASNVTVPARAATTCSCAHPTTTSVE